MKSERQNARIRERWSKLEAEKIEGECEAWREGGRKKERGRICTRAPSA